MQHVRPLLVLGAIVLFLSPLGAQESMKMPGGVQGSFLKLQSMLEKESVSLAEAIPQEKYSWRPMEGVRSIAEAFMHLALGNYIVMQTIGVKLPEGIDLKTFQTSTTDKAKIVEALKTSFAFIDGQVGKIPDSDLDREVSFFGNKMDIRDMILVGANHEHEVLGQAIAYARMNQIVPPWTAERMKKMKEQKQEGK
jgi:uncharacterized damage-inducible protein DinB